MEQLTQEELQSLQEVVAQYEEVSFRVGQFTIEIEGAKEERKKMVEMANQALNQRMEILKGLEEKYGTDSRFNVATGEITKA
jgi:DNA repair ATPase RecN